MKFEAMLAAVEDFNEAKNALGALPQTLGLPPAVCVVRLRKHGDDGGYLFFDLRADAGAVWGKMREKDATGRTKTLVMHLDPESVESVEFEVYGEIAE